MKDYRLVVLGSGGVGKTSLVSRFLKGIFVDNYIPTVEDIHRPIIRLPDGDIHGVEILDTAGLHQFPAMRRLSIQSGRAFIVVFSLEDSTTLDEAITFTDSVRQIKGEDAPVVLVGNKSDLDERRTVMTSEALKMAEARHCAYVEASARSNDNIQKVFLEMLNEIFREEKPETEESNTKGSKRLSFRLRKAIFRSRSRSSGRSLSSSSDEFTDECNNNNNSGTSEPRPKAGCSIM